MTRENAIRELKIFSGTTRIRLSANFWEALNTAIKALEQETVPREHYEHEYFLRKLLDFKVARLEKQIAEQEPCEDAISRKAVIKAVDSHTFDTDNGLCLDNDISCILEELSPVTPTHILEEWMANI